MTAASPTLPAYRNPAFTLAAVTFAILVLELAMIRWLTTKIRAAALVTACFWAIVVVFLLPGTMVGALFESMPPLRAYAADLAGSLAGVVAMAVVAALWTPPPVWIALGALPLLWLHRDRWTVAAAIVAVAAAAYSIDGARFSPYN